MSAAVATARKPKASRGRGSRRPPAAPRPWWGDGAAPLDLWPGVTVDFTATWNAERRRWETHGGKYYFDAAAADTACNFFPLLLTHHIGEFAGQPFELMEYQKKLLTRPIFGWKHAATGLRRFRKVFAFIPKGGGKSPWAAGTAIYCVRLDGEPAAEGYAVAADRNQARVVHDNAKILVESSPDLMDGCEITKDAIVWGNDVLKVLSSDAATKHGFRPHVVAYDEMHAAAGRDLYEALWRSMIKRRQPLMIITTHAGVDDEGICHEEYEYAKGVLSGSNPDETCLPVIFEMAPEDDWTDPAVWRRVNPGHGVTVKHDAVAQLCEEAKAEPRKLNDFLMFQGNRWVNQAVAWIPIDWWDACDDPMPSDEELALYQCANGTDMAQKIDLAANVTVFRLPLQERPATGEPTALEVLTEDAATGAVIKRTVDLNYRIAIVPRFWLPEDTLKERVRQDHIRYDVYHDAGLLEVTEGSVINEQAIVRYVKDSTAKADLVRRFPLLKQGQFGYDPAFATAVALQLAGIGLTTVEVLQNYTHLNEACQVFEALVKAGRVVHGGHRLLRWNVENVAVRRDDAGRIRPVKPKKATKRIDGVVATLIALNRLILMPPMTPRPRKGPRVWTPDGFVPVGGETPAEGTVNPGS